MKKKTNSINYAQKHIDKFFYTVFAPIVKAARPKRQKKTPAIRELEKIFTGACGRMLKEQLTTTFAELLDMIERGEISAKTLGAMLDIVKEKIKMPADSLARLDKIRDLAYKTGKDSVKNPPAANIDTSLTDKLASEWARTDNSYWIGNAFENVGNRLSEKIPEYIEAGMGRKEAGARLEELFADEYSRGKTYWRGLAATALNRSRVFGQITGYEAGGVTTYEIRAMMDERTSPICKFMNGKRFTVAGAAKTRDDIINSEPRAIKRKHPWLSFKTVQNMSDAELQQAGFIMPPFHFHCRTTTVAVGVGIDAENKYMTTADPVRDVLGSIKDSHPEEMKRIRKEALELGVEMIENPRIIAYAPGLTSGEPGQLHLSENDSYGAWLHEERHMLDDKEDGWLGFYGIVDVDIRCQREYNAYKIEIKLARELGNKSLEEQLVQLYKDEIRKIGGVPVEFE